jgi:hypothetical protein
MEQGAADASAMRRNPPIQRPTLPLQRESYTTPPPGLSSEMAAPGAEAPASHGHPYGKSAAIPSGRYTNFANAPHMSPEEMGEAAPGFPQYYGQGAARSPYSSQQHPSMASNANAYSRSMEIAKPVMEQGRQAQSFAAAPWSTYSVPQSQHSNYYPNSHYSQHIYPDAASYHVQQQPYGMPANGRYQHQSAASYSTQNAYMSSNFYVSSGEHSYGAASRPSNPQQMSRQVFQNAFPQSKNI